MKKIYNYIKEKDLGKILILTTIIVAVVLLFSKLNPYDELWNFANCYKMFNGHEIYKDINVIITPLFFYISQIFFCIFGATMLGFRIYNIVISTTVIFLIYKLFLKLNIEKNRAYVYTLLILFLTYTMIAAGANYNIMALIPILINILLILKNKKNTSLFGILLFITFLIKQNIFVYHALAIIIYEFISKQDIKEFIKRIMKIFIICGTLIIMFLLYLYTNNNLYNFINYCFLGVSEFGTRNIGYEIFGSRYLCISFIIIIFNIFILINKKTRKNMDIETVNNSKLLLGFGIPMLLIAYPIFNYYHTTLASLILIICFIYLIDTIIIRNIFVKSKKTKSLYIWIITAILLFSIYEIGYIIIKLNNTDYYFKNNPYYGTFCDEEELLNIKKICAFVEEQEKNGMDVKILSYKANIHMIQLNKNNGIFDMPFLGNLGIEGETALINNIKDMKNTLLLIETDEEKIFGQESKKVREYIIENYTKIGEIQEYSIYDTENFRKTH